MSVGIFCVRCVWFMSYFAGEKERNTAALWIIMWLVYFFFVVALFLLFSFLFLFFIAISLVDSSFLSDEIFIGHIYPQFYYFPREEYVHTYSGKMVRIKQRCRRKEKPNILSFQHNKNGIFFLLNIFFCLFMVEKWKIKEPTRIKKNINIYMT